MESMTGFARQSKEHKEFNYSLQVKSLNARFLEFKFHMPPALSYLEEDFRKDLKRVFERGTFEINFYFRKSNLDVPVKSLKPWIRQYKKMAKELGVSDDLTMSKILHKASSESDYSLKSQEKKIIIDAFKKVLKDLQKRRVIEGRSLKGVLQKEVSNIHRELKLVKAEVKVIKRDTQRGLTNKFKKLRLESEQSKLDSELALILEKADITEEVDRLGIHLKEFSKIMNAQVGLKGKKLDFFCQELAREANTIASKSKSTELTRLSVNLKSNVEKLRQQVQNIQ